MTTRPPFYLVRRPFCGLALGLLLVILRANTVLAKGGQTYYEEGRFEEALEQFIAEQVERPDDAKVMINLGTTLYRLKRFKEAAAAFERAAQTQDPKLKQHALYDLGNSQFREQAFEEAVKSYERAVAADPNDIDARENLAVAKAALAQQPQDKDPKDQDPNRKQSEDPNHQSGQPSGTPDDKPEPGEKKDSSPSPGETEKPTEDNGRGAPEEPAKDLQDEKQPERDPSKKEKESPQKNSEGAQADQEAPTTMSRERAEQLLNKLGETKTVRPQTQKARPPAGGKSW